MELLPGDLKKEIVKQLRNPSFVEIDAIRSISKEWKEAILSFREGSCTEEKPWLLYHKGRSGECHIYDPVRERNYRRIESDPNLVGARFLGSTAGWIVMTNSIERNIPRNEHTVFLYNPFTMVRHDLPLLTAQDHPNPSCEVVYGVVTRNPTQKDFYCCLITNNFFANNRGRKLSDPFVEMYYIAKRNGKWDTQWSVTSIDDHMIYEIESISPSMDKLSIFVGQPCERYDFNFQTEKWTKENDLLEIWDPFDDQSFTDLKRRLHVSPDNVPAAFRIIGTSNDRMRMHIMSSRESDSWKGDDSDLVIDGVWVEVLP